MRYLTFTEIWKLHNITIDRTGGTYGLQYRSSVESSLDRLQADRSSTPVDKAAILWWHLGTSKPFIDGNKITAYTAAEVFLMMNGWKINASADELERVMMELEAGDLKREELTKWLESHVQLEGS